MSGGQRRNLKPVGQGESLEQKMQRFRKRQASLGVSWRDVDQIALKGAICAALADGAALMFSPANGGRGVCLTLWANNDKVKEYAVDHDELNELLGSVIDAFQSSSEDVRLVVS